MYIFSFPLEFNTPWHYKQLCDYENLKCESSFFILILPASKPVIYFYHYSIKVQIIFKNITNINDFHIFLF